LHTKQNNLTRYSAFANTEGGLILLGVEETETHQLTAVGVKDSHKLISDFWNTIQMLDSGRVAEKMSDKKSKVYPDTPEQGPDTLRLYPDTSEQGLDTFKQGPDTSEIKLSDKQKEVINFCSIPRSSKEILEHIGLSYHSKNRATYIISLVNAGYLKRTNPNTTDAYNQKYKRG
jgi:hypothetical protein